MQGNDEDEPEVFEATCNAFALLVRGVEADVLEVLGKSYDSQSTTSIAARCGRSRNQVKEILRFYESNEVVRTIVVGPRRWYVLNVSSPLYWYIRSLGAMTLTRKLNMRDYHEH